MAEIAEDQPLIEPRAAWPKQFWAYMLRVYPVAGTPTHPAYLGNLDFASATYQMPTDFTALGNLFLIIRPTATANRTLSITIRFAQTGEAYNTHTQTQAVVVPLVNLVLYGLDLVPLFGALLANLTPGDHMEVLVQLTIGFDVYICGLDGRY